MTAINPRTIDILKGEGHFFSAGALARQLGHPCQYGCHFGLRSGRDAAVREFTRGWEAAGKEA